VVLRPLRRLKVPLQVLPLPGFLQALLQALLLGPLQ
jgi:hypothetical protein